MVCQRCILAVKNLLQDLRLPYTNVQLGEVELVEELSDEQKRALQNGMQKLGFELLDDARRRIIEKIKTIIINQIHYNADSDQRYNLSDVLAAQLHKDYSCLSHLFSEVEGITIERYNINQKIEKAKELLVYDESTLSEIAFQLGYSSVAHLSAQFKKVTGLSPSHFKKSGASHRKTLDAV